MTTPAPARPSSTVEGFSLSHAAILDGTTGAERVDGDIYGIRTGTLALDTGNYDNTGDDAVLSTWFWFNHATVTVQSGYVPFETLAMLSNTEVTTTGTGDDTQYSMPLWDERANNTPTRPMLIRVPSKDRDGRVRELDFVLFKVQFQPFGLDGTAYKSGLLLNYTGRALVSDRDERGVALPGGRRAIGRLVSKPVGAVPAGTDPAPTYDMTLTTAQVSDPTSPTYDPTHPNYDATQDSSSPSYVPPPTTP